MSDLLGKKVKCKITNFEGTATGYCVYWPDPRPSYYVTPVVDSTGKYNDSKWIDNVNLEEV